MIMPQSHKKDPSPILSNVSFTPFRPIYLVDGTRTPFLKARGAVGPFTGVDLAVHAAQQLLMRHHLPPKELDEVVTGCVMPSVNEANIARIIALRLGCGDKIPAYTVQRNCASGLQAIDSAWRDMRLSDADLVLACGTEAMSHAPVILRKELINWLARFNFSKTLLDKIKALVAFPFMQLKPIFGLEKGLSDPLYQLSMGQTAEIIAHRFGITRKAMDQFANESHLRVVQAQKAGYFTEELIALFDEKGKVYEQDDGVRADSTVEKLAQLKAFFDKKYGLVTAGNSSQITDGAACVLLASETLINRYHLTPLARIVDIAWAGVSPTQMGLGPVHAIAKLLARQQLKLADIDYWEINEAFAGQVLACLSAMKETQYCTEEVGLDKALGELPLEKLNVDGGAVALGHPVGTSGTRITLHLAHILKSRQAKRGVASLCIGGGQGGAILLERV